ncbi:MAG TPA: dihydroorotase [Blastocatellia bacterium]|nr:dihydroorotase [Blastocatellia bacterium]
MKLLITGGRIIDPSQNVDEVADLLIEDGRIKSIGNDLLDPDAEVFDAAGLVVSPGFVDLHVHLREPGDEYKETVASGAKAAVAGGFTTICAMPNTNPVNDNASVTRHIIDKAREAGLAHVHPVGAITRRSEGEELAEMAEMREAGAVAVSDDGRPVMNSQVMRHAMEYAHDHSLVIVDHCQDLNLSAGGVMHEGRFSTLLGLKGMSSAAEESHVSRDILLAELTGTRVHIAHISTKGSVDLVRAAKHCGIPVTCEVTPHHLALTDEAVLTFDTNTKMSPPLRSEEDRQALIDGLRDGTIDAIATDHAPHHMDEKMYEYDRAPFGVVGLETALGVSISTLCKAEGLPLSRVIEALTIGPARVFSLDCGTLSPGAVADVTVFDPDHEWKVDPYEFYSRSRNTPFAGWKLRGRVVATFVNGREVFRLPSASSPE